MRCDISMPRSLLHFRAGIGYKVFRDSLEKTRRVKAIRPTESSSCEAHCEDITDIGTHGIYSK